MQVGGWGGVGGRATRVQPLLPRAGRCSRLWPTLTTPPLPACPQAVRKGHWIVLDELNLAPTDVLEALNRCAAVVRGRGAGPEGRGGGPGCRGLACRWQQSGAHVHDIQESMGCSDGTPPLQAAGRQPRAVRARAAGGGAPPPPLHAVCHPKPAGHLRWAQDAEPVCGWAGDSAPCLMFAPALAPAPELIEALARPAASCPTVDVVMLPLTGPSARASWSCTSRTSPTASSAPSWRRGAVGRGDALLSSVFSAFTPHQK